MVVDSTGHPPTLETGRTTRGHAKWLLQGYVLYESGRSRMCSSCVFFWYVCSIVFLAAFPGAPDTAELVSNGASALRCTASMAVNDEAVGREVKG